MLNIRPRSYIRGRGEGGEWGIVIERICGVEFAESYFLGGWVGGYCFSHDVVT